MQQLPANHEEGEGWRVVRAKKKSIVGSGVPGFDQTRPRSGGDKSADKGVSTSHWPNQKSTFGKVFQSANSLKQKKILNFKSTPSTAPCPISPFDKGGLDGDQPGINTCPLEPPSFSSVGPTLSESSAGHMPFPNRLANLAREIRGRQSSRPGQPKNSSGMAGNVGLFSGLKPTLLTPLKNRDVLGDERRQANIPWEQNADVIRGDQDGPNGIVLQDRFEQNEREEHTKNSDSEDDDEAMEDRESDQFLQKSPFLFDRGKQTFAAEKMEMEKVSGRTVNIEERRRAGIGQTTAEHHKFLR